MQCIGSEFVPTLNIILVTLVESSPKANQAVLWCVGESEGGGSAQNVNVAAAIVITIIVIIAIISGIFITNINSIINLTMIMTITITIMTITKVLDPVISQSCSPKEKVIKNVFKKI